MSLFFQPCERLPIVYNSVVELPDELQTAGGEVPENFFDVTVSDVRKMYSDLKNQRSVRFILNLIFRFVCLFLFFAVYVNCDYTIFVKQVFINIFYMEHISVVKIHHSFLEKVEKYAEIHSWQICPIFNPNLPYFNCFEKIRHSPFDITLLVVMSIICMWFTYLYCCVCFRYNLHILLYNKLFNIHKCDFNSN